MVENSFDWGSISGVSVQRDDATDKLWSDFINREGHNSDYEVEQYKNRYRAAFANIGVTLSSSIAQGMYEFIRKVYYRPADVNLVYSVITKGGAA